MKRLVLMGLLILGFIGIVILPFGCERVEQGFRGAKVDLLASGKGSIQEVGPGRQFFVPWRTDLVQLPVHVQRYAYVKDPEEESKLDQSIQAVSSDNLEFTVGVSLHYKVSPKDGCIKKVYREYKMSNFRNFSQTHMRDLVRESVHNVYSQYEATEIYGNKRPEVMKAVTEDVKAEVSKRVSVDGTSCLIIDNLSLAELRPPQSVKRAVEQKMEAQQEAQKERAELQKQKLASKRDSVKAYQDAKNNERLAESITPELIQYERLQMMKEKWDGQLPRAMSGEGGGMLLQMDPNR